MQSFKDCEIQNAYCDMWIGNFRSCWPCADSCLFTVCLMVKHSSTTLGHVCEGHLKNKKKFMEHHIIPSMVKVVFNWWGLYILLWGQVFVHVPLHWGFHIISFTFQELTHTCMCYVCNFDQHFVCAPMPHFWSPYQIHIWKRDFTGL